MIRLLPILALILLAAPVRAQSVAEYYHHAAQRYIAGADAEAEAAALAGLALAPDDARLQALLEQIRQRQQESGGQQGQDESDQQQPGDGPQQQGQEGDEQESDEGEQEQDGEGQPQEPSEQPPGEPQSPQPGDAGTQGEQNPGAPGDGAFAPEATEPGQMSRAEAERILQAIEADELQLLRDVQRRQSRPRYVEKDW